MLVSKGNNIVTPLLVLQISQLSTSKLLYNLFRMSASPSATFRHEGNRMYKSACLEGLSPVIQLERLQKARNLYSR